MNNYQFPESVLSVAFSTCFRYAAQMPVETPIELTRTLLDTLESYIDNPIPGHSTAQSIAVQIVRLSDARSQMVSDPENCPDPDVDFQFKVAMAVMEAWTEWWRAENELAMGTGPDDAWDRCSIMFRETQCYGKMEVPEDDTLALEDKADFEDTPF